MEIDKEIKKALGNLNIEGMHVSGKEYENIVRILEKYKDKLGDNAIESLLYSLTIGLENNEQNKRNSK